MRTFQGRPALSAADAAALAAYGDLFGRTLRTLHARRAAKKRDDKPGLMREFGLTARQFNAVRVSLDGMEASIRARLPELVDDVARRLKSTTRRLASAEDPAKRHQLARRAFRLTTRLARLRADAQSDTIRIAFGSKRLFRAQNALADNGYANHDAWRRAWREARSESFFVLGSRDESCGNQGCSASALGDGLFGLRLRLPNRLVAEYGKYLVTTVHIAHGAAHIEHALATKQAISFRFKRDEKGWRVFISTEEIAVEPLSDRGTGTLGVDLNADHLALALSDRFASVIGRQKFSRRYGISGHLGAALAIARRARGFSERVSRHGQVAENAAVHGCDQRRRQRAPAHRCRGSALRRAAREPAVADRVELGGKAGGRRARSTARRDK